MLRKHLSLFLALLMIFTAIPEASLAENGVDEPESPTSIGFLNADSCDEAFVYHYTVEASPGDTIMLTPEPDYNGDGELSYRWMRFDAAQGIYVELPDETGSTLEITVSEDEFAAEALYACEVSDGEISGTAGFTITERMCENEAGNEAGQSFIAATHNELKTASVGNIPVLLANVDIDYSKYISPNPGSYNADDALTYARTHYNDGQGLCAEFVATCLNAGGLNIPRYTYTHEVLAWLEANGYNRVSLVGKTMGNYDSFWERDNKNLVSPGDILFYVPIGEQSTANNPFHTVIASGFGQKRTDNRLLAYGHNPAWNQLPADNYITATNEATQIICINMRSASNDKPDMTANMSANDYLTYYAQSVTTFTGTATPKNGTLRMYNLPTTLSNTVGYTTTTGSVKLTKKVVNHAGNTWYQIDSGKFVYSGDINISSAPTIINIDKGSITQTSAVIKAEVGHSSSNKPTSWTLEYGTTGDLSNAKTHTEKFTDAVLNADNPVPISVTFGVEEPNLKPGTRYYYRFTVESANAAPVVSEIRDFDTLECSSHSYNSLGVCTACGTSYDWSSTRSTNSSWLKGNMTVRSTPYDAATSIGSTARIQAQATVKNCSGILWYQVSYNGQTGYIKADSATIFTPVTGITLSHSSASLVPGDTLSLAATILPSGATEKSVTWSSNSTSVATVTQSGVVTAVSPGTAVIKVTSIDNASATASCTVTVSSILTTQVIIDSVFSEVEIGVPVKLEAHVLPTNATVQGVNWVLKNGTGSGEISNGYFIGRSAGTVTLEAHSADGITYNTMTVTVKLSGASIEEGLRAAIANKDEAYYISGDVTLSADIVIPDYLTLYIEDSGSLTIPNGVTLTNNSFIGVFGSVTVESGGKIVNNRHIRAYDGSVIVIDEGGVLENNRSISIDSPTYVNGTYIHGDEAVVFVFSDIKEDENQLLVGIPKELVMIEFFVETEDEIHAAFAKRADGYVRVYVQINESITLSSDLEIPQGCTLDLEDQMVLRVPQGKALINNGGIGILNGSTLLIEEGAELENNAFVEVVGTLNVQGNHSGNKVDIYEGGILIPDTIPHCTEGVLVESIDILGPDTVLINSENEYAYVLAPDDVWIDWAMWSIVSGESLAEIDEHTGVLTTGNIEGEIVIRAYSMDESDIYGEKTINIKSAFDYMLTVISADTSMGTVTGGGKYNAGAIATITATPKEGYEFVKWNDGDTSASRTVTVNADKTYTATFKKKVVSADAANFYISNISAQAGEYATIAVNVSNNPGISGFTISVAFSNSAFEFDSIAVNSDIISSITDNVIVKDNVCTVTATYFSANGDFTDNGELFGIKLKVRENAEPGEYAVGLKIKESDVCNNDLALVPFDTVDGSIEIAAFVYGDIFVDGVIDIRDLVYFAQYMAGRKLNPTSQQIMAMDVYRDDTLDIRDLVKLAQYVAGRPLVLGTK